MSARIFLLDPETVEKPCAVTRYESGDNGVESRALLAMNVAVDIRNRRSLGLRARTVTRSTSRTIAEEQRRQAEASLFQMSINSCHELSRCCRYTWTPLPRSNADVTAPTATSGCSPMTAQYGQTDGSKRALSICLPDQRSCAPPRRYSRRVSVGYAPHGRRHPIVCRWVLTGTMPIADPSHRLTMEELWDDEANRLTFCPERSTC